MFCFKKLTEKNKTTIELDEVKLLKKSLCHCQWKIS